MPNEMRRLIFNNNEVLQALMDFNTRSGNKHFPSGIIGELEILGEPHTHINTTVEIASGRKEDVVIETPTIGAAIIGYCMRHAIPLPNNADKSLKVMNAKIVMDITSPSRKAANRPEAEPTTEIEN